ncbi:MAG: multifunctional oxoglutarate decarboxylase/oxoglutarate dehydrogenase thiamine pyrophosphate-binding subunit/dihydrolipoyllysine-residue succinyltransferase subunit, partial [Acidobacteria bacterium]
MSQQKKTDLSETIAEEFGANAEYVQTLFERFRSNPQLVDDSWRAYFNELTGDGAAVSQTSGNGAKASAVVTDGDGTAVAKQPAPAPQPKAITTQTLDAAAEVIPIRGPALKIVENMETSLTVPTATSERRIPVKLLDENRRLINRHLAEHDRKASYTHLIAWAILRALDEFPQLNDGFASVDGVASRVKRSEINLG